MYIPIKINRLFTEKHNHRAGYSAWIHATWDYKSSTAYCSVEYWIERKSKPVRKGRFKFDCLDSLLNWSKRFESVYGLIETEGDTCA